MIDAIHQKKEDEIQVTVASYSAFYIAIEHNDVNMLHWLLLIVHRQNYPFDIHHKRESILRTACRDGNEKIVRLLLSWTMDKKTHPQMFREHFIDCINSKNTHIAKILSEYLRAIDKEDEFFTQLCEDMSRLPVFLSHVYRQIYEFKIIELLCDHNSAYHFVCYHGKVIEWRIKDFLDAVSVDELDKHTCLTKVTDETIECQICYETHVDDGVTIYRLPCSLSDSDHFLCGTCIHRIRKRNKLQCPLCTLTTKLH